MSTVVELTSRWNVDRLGKLLVRDERDRGRGATSRLPWMAAAASRDPYSAFAQVAGLGA